MAQRAAKEAGKKTSAEVAGVKNSAKAALKANLSKPMMKTVVVEASRGKWTTRF
jgi:hypothetical protein